MRILHSADWHIGRTLYGRTRYQEFEAFLTWLLEKIEEERIDVLLVSGDVFDTTTPSNRAQKLYYNFLTKVVESACQHVVVTAGNHDSPTFLSATKELLRPRNVHVVGSPTELIEDEVLILKNSDGLPALIVCAVPYLRDRDIRSAAAGESIEDKERKLLEGIKNHYATVVTVAEQQRNRLQKEFLQLPQIPLVVMGHLFTAGGQTVEGDGVRELYVGSLAHISAGLFPENIDYLALGHLHVPQKVSGSEVMRYSGSPIPMGFGEANQQKSVCIVEFSAGRFDKEIQKLIPEVAVVPVPTFQKLVVLKGSLATILREIAELVSAQSNAWLEVVYEGTEIVTNLREQIETAVQGSQLEVLRVRNKRVMEELQSETLKNESLDDLDTKEVFERCLNAGTVSEEQRVSLRLAFQETLHSLNEDDHKAE